MATPVLTGSRAAAPIDPSPLVPEGTRLVHIGPPKTGTTAVQGAFNARRADVLAQGVRYAGRSRHSGGAVLAVAGRPSFQRDSGPPPIGRWNTLASEVRRAREARVLVSSEFFADAEVDRIPRIVADLGGDAVHVVVTLRPLARLLASQWQQYVQSFMRLSFDGWLDGVLNGPEGKVTPTFWRRHRHDALIDRWAAVVGPENMTVVVVDEHDHEHVLRVFEQLVGLRAGTLEADDDVTNRSMTLAEIEAVRAFNVAFHDAGLRNALFHKVMHFGAAAYMKQRAPASDEARIETPQWALDRSGEIAREMVDRISASGVRIIGDLESLTVVPKSGLSGDRQPKVCVPPAIAAAMGTGVAVVAGFARGNTRANEMAAAAGAPGASNGVARSEPSGIGRFSTYHLAGVIPVRWLAGVRRRVTAFRGAGRSSHAASGERPPGAAEAVALGAFGAWLRDGEFRPNDQARLAAGAAAGLGWGTKTPAPAGQEPSAASEPCISPGTAANLALGVLSASGLVREGNSLAAPGAATALSSVRFPWAEPPELAVVTSRQLVKVVLGRILRGRPARRGD